MTTKTNGRYDTEFKKMIAHKCKAGESVLNLCKDFNLKEGTVYPWIKQYSKSGTTGNAAIELNHFSNDEYLQMQKNLEELNRKMKS